MANRIAQAPTQECCKLERSSDELINFLGGGASSFRMPSPKRTTLIVARVPPHQTYNTGGDDAHTETQKALGA